MSLKPLDFKQDRGRKITNCNQFCAAQADSYTCKETINNNNNNKITKRCDYSIPSKDISSTKCNCILKAADPQCPTNLKKRTKCDDVKSKDNCDKAYVITNQFSAWKCSWNNKKCGTGDWCNPPCGQRNSVGPGKICEDVVPRELAPCNTLFMTTRDNKNRKCEDDMNDTNKCKTGGECIV